MTSSYLTRQLHSKPASFPCFLACFVFFCLGLLQKLPGPLHSRPLSPCMRSKQAECPFGSALDGIFMPPGTSQRFPPDSARGHPFCSCVFGCLAAAQSYHKTHHGGPNVISRLAKLGSHVLSLQISMGPEDQVFYHVLSPVTW